MAHIPLIIKGGHVTDPATSTDGCFDIFIAEGLVKEVSKNITISGRNNLRIIDASGKYVIPGLIDCHVHLREPGFEYKETIETGSHAAAMGGYTTLICEPNTKPPIDSVEMVEFLMEKVRQKSAVNIYTKACITMGLMGEELTDINKLAKNRRVRALSDDGNPVLYENVMKRACELAAQNNIVISPHCEDSHVSLDRAKKDLTVTRFPGKPFCHETEFIMRDIQCAEQAKASLHISHVSMRNSLDVIRQAKERGDTRITCEVTPHHLILDENYRYPEGNVPIVNPPLRTPEDTDALQKGLLDTSIDVIATDHAPHTREDIQKGASGFVGLETALGVILTKFVHTGILTLKEVIQKMSTNPARIFNIHGGSIAVGMPADIAIIDLEKEWTVDVNKFRSKSRNSPFHGWQLKGRVATTIVGGKVIVDNSMLIG